MDTAEKLVAVAENVPKVYEAGQKSEYDRFWDIYQDNGNRKDYKYAFAGVGWSKNFFNPKYKIKPVNTTSTEVACYMFANCVPADGTMLEINLDNADFTQVTKLQFTFNNAKMSKVDIDIPNVTTITSLVNGAQGVNNWRGGVKHLVLRNGTNITSMSTTAAYNQDLEEVEFINTPINIKGWTFAGCKKLSKQAQINIINALSSTTSGLTVTISKVAKEAAFTDDEWAVLEATKPNWTIALV